MAKKMIFAMTLICVMGGVSSMFGQQIVVHYGYPGIRIPIGDTIVRRQNL